MGFFFAKVFKTRLGGAPTPPKDKISPHPAKARHFLKKEMERIATFGRQT
jgi:hypothetical protein